MTADVGFVNINTIRIFVLKESFYSLVPFDLCIVIPISGKSITTSWQPLLAEAWCIQQCEQSGSFHSNWCY